MDLESEQNERPTYGSTMRRRVSDTRVPPNTEEDEDVDYPWTDRLLERESDENSSIDIQQNGRKFQFNEVTIYVSANSMVHSGANSRNSDIGPCRIFQTTMKRQGWYNCRVVEYPVVNVMDVSNIWIGARKI